MGRVTLKLPRLGETMEEARVTGWLVAEGADYARGDILMEVETDKTVVEVPALAAGTLRRRLVGEGDTVALDAPIAEVEEDGAEEESADTAEARPESAEVETPQKTRPEPARPEAGAPRIAASPAARAQAKQSRVNLSAVQGTGRRKRVTAADVRAADATGANKTGADSTGGPADDGVTFVLLHGLFDTAEGWRDLARRLRARGQGVVTPDLPGHGADPEVASSFDMAADMLAARLPDGNLHLVGHSLGAALAARLAAMKGARGLTLIAPAGIDARISDDFISGMANAASPAAYARATSHLGLTPPSDTALATRLAAHLDGLDRRLPLARAVARNGVQQIDALPDIAAASCPVTVIWGTGDRVLDWRAVANLPFRVRINLLRAEGHVPHLSRPADVAELILPAKETAGNARQAG